MTREELRDYIERCPEDAMGDFSVFLKDGDFCNREHKYMSDNQTLQKNGVYEEQFFDENMKNRSGGDCNGN